MNTNQDQKHEIDLLRRQLTETRQDLNDARSDWESSAEAIREAIESLDVAESVQAQLVAALQGLMVKYIAFVGDSGEDRRLESARAALAAAGVTT